MAALAFWRPGFRSPQRRRVAQRAAESRHSLESLRFSANLCVSAVSPHPVAVFRLVRRRERLCLDQRHRLVAALYGALPTFRYQHLRSARRTCHSFAEQVGHVTPPTSAASLRRSTAARRCPAWSRAPRCHTWRTCSACLPVLPRWTPSVLIRVAPRPTHAARRLRLQVTDFGRQKR